MIENVGATRRALLAWYAASKRTLPWRRSRRDPWHVWVSEIMLQQTRVDAVVEPYRRFIRRFPTLASMARADVDDVLAEWSGLGYYRRARLLHAGARHVAANHAGRLPRSRAALEQVPGIGAYTAGAILALAFGEREAAVDANVLRVVARLAGIAGVHTAAGRARVVTFAARLVDCESPAEINEALMDLGSAVCTARVVRCDECPLARFCIARSSGAPLGFAASRPKPAARDVRIAYALVRDGTSVLVLRRADDDRLLGGLWDLPSIDMASERRRAQPALAELIRSRTGVDVRVGRPLFDVRHDIVGRRIVATIHDAEICGRVPKRLPDGARMIAPGTRRDIGMPALPAKILAKLEETVARRADGSDVTGRSGTTGRAIPERAPRRSRAARVAT